MEESYIKKICNNELQTNHFLSFNFLNWVHSMQGYTAAARHEVTRKRRTKRLNHRKSLSKEPNN